MAKRRRKKGRAGAVISLIISAAVIVAIVIAVVRPAVYRDIPAKLRQLASKQEEELIDDIYLDISSIPEYTGEAYTEINGNVPELDIKDGVKEFERYDPLDSLGRCRAAYVNVSPLTMPDKERESIGSVKPSGWHLVKYDGIDGNYLYNRCHLVAYQLSGENANELNLITGTRYMNTQGMLPFEIKVGDYVKKTGNHVLYKVVPVFKDDNLLAEGVWIQAASVEDDEIRFNVFCYNVQPGIGIDYSNGDSWRE